MDFQDLNVLIVGNGGREHAIAWKLSQSPKVKQIYVCPGNGGTADSPKCSNITNISEKDFAALVAFAKEKSVGLLFPGPEAPLVDGIVDYFQKHAPEIKCFGPTEAAARMEGSKAFSKDFMKRHNIPTAAYQNFTSYDEARKYLDRIDHSVVLKASGLAAGKGVIIPNSKQEAHAALQEIMLDKAFGNAGDEVVIEEFLQGNEISILTFSDGKTIRSLPPAQDHKRIYDHDLGPNTGGMGTYAPAPEFIVNGETLAEIDRTVLQPTIDGMKKEGMPFVGCLFTGFMMTKNGPRVLEYNVRFGDPETQSLMLLLDTDIAELIMASTTNSLDKVELKVKPWSAATVVVAAGGYPNSYRKGLPMSLTSLPEGVLLFHAGTLADAQGLKTAGGRVIAASAAAETLEKAIKKAYEGVACIKFEGMQFRKDIGARAL